MIDAGHELPIARQAQALEISRASFYWLPQPTPQTDLALMREIDRLHLEHPFAAAECCATCCGCTVMRSAASTWPN